MSNNSKIPKDYPVPSRIPLLKVEDIPTEQDVLACRIGLKLALTRFTGMFKSRNALPESTWDSFAASVKNVSDKVREHRKIRQWIGSSLDVWWDLHTMLAMAVPTIKEQCFFPVDSDESSSVTAFMCQNAPNLLRDLDKLNDILIVARNLLANNTSAQVYAAQSGVDQKVLQLLETCVRVSSRTVDCDTDVQQDRINQDILQSFKILMITCIQFLHNLIVENESRKLALFIDLFGWQIDNRLGVNSLTSAPLEKPAEGLQFKQGITVFNYQPEPEWDPTETFPRLKSIMEALRAVHLVSLRDEEEDKRLADDFTLRSEKLLNDLDESTDRNNARRPQVLKFFKDILSPDDYKEKPTSEKVWMPLSARLDLHKKRKRALVKDVPVPFPELDSPRISHPETNTQATNGLEQTFQNNSVAAKDGNGAQQATLSQSHQSLNSEFHVDANGMDGHEDHDDDEDEDDEDDEYEDDSDEQEDDYDPYAASYKQHGLLAEIPLICSPNEVEPLMLLLHNGVMPPQDATHGPEEFPLESQVFQALRCNLLVFSEQGRHLLRELLIYIAAWDLAEEDLYFKLLLNIVKSILQDGYVMLAYNGYREPKDVVSPSQQALIKCLQNIFRKHKEQGPPHCPDKNCPEDEVPARLQRDRTCVYDMIIEFRTHVIPRTIAFIWLQGKIREQQAIPDDFPLNLWDVERIYEGVYQFIEFFAVLAETPTWKRILVEQNLAFELVELLRALDTSIPKIPLTSSRLNRSAPHPAADPDRVHSPPHNEAPSGPVPVAVERPYDSLLGSPTTAAPESPPEPSVPEIMDAWKYEWRNLKKLVILCLSSLIWQTPKVKQQVRELSGVELIMGCCTVDENNHFIKEHALLCLQFMVEDSVDKEGGLRFPDAEEEGDGEDGLGDEGSVGGDGSEKAEG